MLLSIIIPAYNVSKYIANTLESTKGTFLLSGEVEVIIVNDGSTDETKSIIIENMHQGFHLIDCKNSGVSKARNIAIESSVGKYITFLDGDDILRKDAIQKLLIYLRENNTPDVIVMRSYTNNQENYPWNKLFSIDTEYASTDLFNKGYSRGSVCGCAFNRSFIDTNKIRFLNGLKYGEDSLFFATNLLENAKYVFKDIPFYQVVERNDSASRNILEMDWYNYRIGIDWLLKKRKELHYKQNMQIVDYKIYSIVSDFSNKATIFKMPYVQAREVIAIQKIPWLTWKKSPNCKFKILLFNCSFFIYYNLVLLKKIIYKQ